MTWHSALCKHPAILLEDSLSKPQPQTQRGNLLCLGYASPAHPCADAFLYSIADIRCPWRRVAIFVGSSLWHQTSLRPRAMRDMVRICGVDVDVAVGLPLEPARIHTQSAMRSVLATLSRIFARAVAVCMYTLSSLYLTHASVASSAILSPSRHARTCAITPLTSVKPTQSFYGSNTTNRLVCTTIPHLRVAPNATLFLSVDSHRTIHGLGRQA